MTLTLTLAPNLNPHPTLTLTKAELRKLKSYDALHARHRRDGPAGFGLVAAWWASWRAASRHPKPARFYRESTRSSFYALLPLFPPRHGILCEPEPTRSEITREIVDWMFGLE